LGVTIERFEQFFISSKGFSIPLDDTNVARVTPPFLSFLLLTPERTAVSANRSSWVRVGPTAPSRQPFDLGAQSGLTAIYPRCRSKRGVHQSVKGVISAHCFNYYISKMAYFTSGNLYMLNFTYVYIS